MSNIKNYVQLQMNEFVILLWCQVKVYSALLIARKSIFDLMETFFLLGEVFCFKSQTLPIYPLCFNNDTDERNVL